MLEYDKGRLRNFPHVYYVNLDNRRDRRIYMEDQFQQWRLEYTRVSSSKYAESKVGEWSNKIDGKCELDSRDRSTGLEPVLLPIQYG